MIPDADWLARAAASATRARAERGAPRTLTLLPRHASLRRYARATFATGADEIVMLMPPADSAPEEAGAGTRVALADDPFVQVQRWLSAIGVPVPAIYAIDAEGDALWLEDLGHTDLDSYQARGAEPREVIYRRALDVLLELQAHATVEGAPAPVLERRFGPELQRWELDHYTEWRLGAGLGLAFSRQPGARFEIVPTRQPALVDAFAVLADALESIPMAPMHRDYQSHNIMVSPTGALTLIDFQDMMIGPVVYDAVALLRDSYVVLTETELSGLVRYWADHRARISGGVLSAEALERWFHLQAVQRKLKDAGRFVYIDRVKHNADFLPFIDDSIAYVRTSLALLPELAGLRAALAELDPGLA